MYKYDPKSLIADEFINDEEIKETLAYAEANKNNFELIDAILEKARPGNLQAAEHGALSQSAQRIISERRMTFSDSMFFTSVMFIDHSNTFRSSRSSASSYESCRTSAKNAAVLSATFCFRLVKKNI